MRKKQVEKDEQDHREKKEREKVENKARNKIFDILMVT